MGKQTTIEGTQDDLVPEIEEAAERVRAITENRKKLQKDEAEARSEVIARMRDAGREAYSYEDGNGRRIVVRLQHGEVKVTVRREAEKKLAPQAEAAE